MPAYRDLLDYSGSNPFLPPFPSLENGLPKIVLSPDTLQTHCRNVYEAGLAAKYSGTEFEKWAAEWASQQGYKENEIALVERHSYPAPGRGKRLVPERVQGLTN